MQESILLEAEGFRLSLAFTPFENDIPFPSNTLVSVSVESVGFGATATMDIDCKDLPAFCAQLQEIYDTLSGTATLREPFGEQSITFFGTVFGTVMVSGHLNSNGANGFFQELKFENVIDQTYLPPILASLSSLIGRLFPT